VLALAGNFLAGLHWKKHRAASCTFKRISFSNINKQYGKQLLFLDASFQLNPGDKVGLVGPNGAGKTTLLPTSSKWTSRKRSSLSDGSNPSRSGSFLCVVMSLQSRRAGDSQ